MKQSILGMALALICAGTVPRPALAEMDSEGCRGNACKDLSGEWINNGYTFYNEGARPMHLGVTAGRPGSCGEETTVYLAPGETVEYGPESFCGPVKAQYVKEAR